MYLMTKKSFIDHFHLAGIVQLLHIFSLLYTINAFLLIFADKKKEIRMGIYFVEKTFFHKIQSNYGKPGSKIIHQGGAALKMT